MADKYYFYYYHGVGGGLFPGKRTSDAPKSPHTYEETVISYDEFDRESLTYLSHRYPIRKLPDLQ